MCEHDIGAIPIGENDRLIGMVTDRDIVCKGLAQDSFDARRATARDMMTPGIHCCRDDDDLAKAVGHMETLKVRRLPVINKSKRMVGILSLGDVGHSASGDLLSECVKAFRPTTETRVVPLARRTCGKKKDGGPAMTQRGSAHPRMSCRTMRAIAARA
jgi:predicted transcriptional regulator